MSDDAARTGMVASLVWIALNVLHFLVLEFLSPGQHLGREWFFNAFFGYTLDFAQLLLDLHVAFLSVVNMEGLFLFQIVAEAVILFFVAARIYESRSKSN